MTAKAKIEDLIAAEDKILARLAAQKRTIKCRVAAFQNALIAINGDKVPDAMAAQKVFESKIAKEIGMERDLELKISDVQDRRAALKESIPLLPIKPKPENKSQSPSQAVPEAAGSLNGGFKELRPQSELYQVREILRTEGKPMLLSEVVQRLGHPADQANSGKYAALRGTIGAYARQKRFFTVESKAPHVIGLLEFKVNQPVH